ncbi:helix-turn-helix domain-containing protein [Rhodococcus erythropolis]|uniref:helix-turn-helix domain-containing protein n=1 Tax=Rhodococcus erythropolis TaxID=1833 RepID=UPI003D0B85E4
MHQGEREETETVHPTGTPVDTQFGEMIKDARRELGWSQRMLAIRLQRAGLKIDPSAITRIETGQREPKLTEAVAIADMLGLDLDDLTYTHSGEFRRGMALVLDNLIDARKAALRALNAVDVALAGATAEAEQELGEVSKYGSAVGILKRQIEMFYEMVDQDKQKSGPNFAPLYGGVDDEIKQYVVDALTHKILRSETANASRT